MSSHSSGYYEMEVVEKTFLSSTVMRVRMAPVHKRGMDYREGQFLSIELSDGDVRSYSMANELAGDGSVELHVRLHKNGKFSELLKTELGHGSRLRVNGPYGDCTWMEPASASSKILMLATGTGLAPLKALLGHALRTGCKNPIWLYWGGMTPDDFYFTEQLRNLERALENFHYIPVLSEPAPDWSGEVGYVQQVAARDHDHLDGAYVYACGAPVMVSSARETLTKTCHLPTKSFFADAFEPSAVTGSVRSEAFVPVLMRNVNGQVSQLNLPEGVSLMEGLRVDGHIKGVCGGNASCGTCRISIHQDWHPRLSPPSRTEKRLLASLAGFHPSDRLACQLIMDKELTGLEFTVPDHLW